MIELIIWTVGLLVITCILGETRIKKGTMRSAILQTAFVIFLALTFIAVGILMTKVGLFLWHLGA